MNNSNTLTAEQAAEQCLPIILKDIRNLEDKYECKAGWLLGDFIQEGYLAALNALGNFDPTKGVKFTTFAYKYILGAIYRAFEAELNRGKTLVSAEGYDEEAEEFSSNSILASLLADPIYEADYAFTSKALRETCDWFLKRVKDPTDRKIVRLSFGLSDGFEHSNEAIGFEMGTSAERVRQRKERAMRQLRRVD